MAFVSKLSNRKVVVTENKETHLLNVPSGIYYLSAINCWGVLYLSEEGWKSTMYSANQRGVIETFLLACEKRLETLGILTKTRLLRRYRNPMKPVKRGRLFWVTDPNDGFRKVGYATEQAARLASVQALEDWITNNGVSLDEVVECA